MASIGNETRFLGDIFVVRVIVMSAASIVGFDAG
jgi:hypothetical protein